MKLLLFCIFLVKLRLILSSNTPDLHHENRTISASKPGTINSISDFEDILKYSTFVDKTMMLREIFDNINSNPFQLITCPPKFGKTTNLNMIKRFLQINIADDTNERYYRYKNLNGEFSNAHKTFTNPKYDLKIRPWLSEKQDFFSYDFNGYFVIHVNFKIVDGTTYDKILKGIRRSLRICFDEYVWLQDKIKRNNFLTLIDFVRAEKIDEDEISTSLWELSRTLHKECGQKIALLIDNYDSPILNAIEHNFDVIRVKRLIEKIISNVLNPDLCYINRALIVGTSYVLHKSKFSNIKHLHFLDNHYLAEFFGFTEEEVNKLFDNHGVDAKERKLAVEYYGGYKTIKSSKRIYNPFSITRYLSDRDTNGVEIQLHNYWAETTEVVDFLKYFKKNKMCCDLLLHLLASRNVSFVAKKYLSEEDLIELQKMAQEDKLPLTDDHTSLFFSYLFDYGYLSHAKERGNYNIANKEIESFLNDLLRPKNKSTGGYLGGIQDMLLPKKSLCNRIWSKLFNKKKDS